MQHIGILLENEQGDKIKSSNLNFADVLVWLFGIKEYQIKYPWLSTIDPYGNTVLNSLQVPLIINELKIFSLEVDEETKKTIELVISFLQDTDQHHYIKLFGD
ncbi:MAG: hypothetical protein V4644_01050 [Patescibacteria group bacterium]